jgi:DNA modification methylase
MSDIEYVSPGQIKPHPANSRRHPREQINQLVNSFREFGFQGVVVIDETGTILVGHGRAMAAMEAGIDRIPAKRVEGWSEAKKRAFVIADNQLGLASEWDEEMLASEIRALMSQGEVDLAVLGFGDQELNELIASTATATDGDTVGWTEDDEAPAAPTAEKTVTQRGDVWVCGDHRVMCGDSTSVTDMAQLVGSVRVRLWLTDPPYNVAYTGGTKESLTIMNDSMGDQQFREFLTAAYKAADSVMAEGASFYIWHADSEGYNFRGAARDTGWPVRQCLIWKKNTLVLGRQDYQWQHEPCLYGWKPGAGHQWFGGRKQTTVATFGAPSPFVQVDDDRWQIMVDGRVLLVSGSAEVMEATPSVINEAKPRRNGEHPTMKPVALFERQVLNSTKAGDPILDSFGGSGTTLIVAEKTARLGRLMELDPRYADVIVRRWQEFAGREATLAADGRSFADVAADRGIEV